MNCELSRARSHVARGQLHLQLRAAVHIFLSAYSPSAGLCGTGLVTSWQYPKDRLHLHTQI